MTVLTFVSAQSVFAVKEVKIMSKKENPNIIMPVLAMRGMVVFPSMVVQFDVGRPKSILAVKAALETDRKIFLVTQTDFSENEPTISDIYKMGVVAKIKQVIHNSNEAIKIHIEGIYRAELNSLVNTEKYLIGDITKCESVNYRESARSGATVRIAIDRFEEYLHWFKHVPPDILAGIAKEKHCGHLADYMASNLNISYFQKQIILEELHPVRRLTKLNEILADEIQILKVETEISRKAQENMDENHREYILREQMKIIASELGEENSPLEESDEFKQRIYALNVDKKVQTKLLTDCDKLARMPSSSHEASVLRSYIEACLSLPWSEKTTEKTNVKAAAKILERDHFGLKKVKERFLEILAVRALNGDTTSQIVCLVGPPGVGKTSIAKSIAEATGRKYVRVSLGGIQDQADIMGHRKTYVGSMPGRIIAAIKQAGVKNPLILLDEIDKLGQSFKGDPSSSLLEVLDPEQNKEFHDHYIDLPFDLSEVLFVTTANNPSTIPGPLYDRMDVISLGSYTHAEKLQIANKYLVKKQLKRHGIEPKQLKFTQKVLEELIEHYTKEAGVRTLERSIASICRKMAMKIVNGDISGNYTLKISDVEELLGARKFNKDNFNKTNEIGLVNGLAWTSVGGEMLPIEVAVMDGKGKIQLTGSLGDVMKESANTAITCIRTMADKLSISSDFYEKKDIHIHAPEGAVPKDGPSAGTAMATAICSALTNIEVRHDIAMTGEITLQGRVLPIGGLKEKAMAAYKNGISTVLIPFDNEADLAEVDDIVKNNVEFISVKRIDEVLKHALVKLPDKTFKSIELPVKTNVNDSAQMTH